mmetsp:Transcript_137799/g.294476  ORF Transcript_137799/g.294476 Transcript_137799/m.294476 type:complete len:217 (+) Transcript_137799:3-653(+)
MVLCQLAHDFVMDAHNDAVARQQVFDYYGTFFRSMMTMFEVSLANWAPACRVLLDNLGAWHAALLVIYRSFLAFALLNVISSVFICQSMKVARKDDDVIIAQKRLRHKTYTSELNRLFRDLDTSGRGYITMMDFREACKTPAFIEWLRALDIECHDPGALFKRLDIADESSITVEELFLSAPHIEGEARNIDVMHVLAHVLKLDRNVETLLSRSSQ